MISKKDRVERRCYICFISHRLSFPMDTSTFSLFFSTTLKFLFCGWTLNKIYSKPTTNNSLLLLTFQFILLCNCRKFSTTSSYTGCPAIKVSPGTLSFNNLLLSTFSNNDCEFIWRRIHFPNVTMDVLVLVARAVVRIALSLTAVIEERQQTIPARLFQNRSKLENNFTQQNRPALREEYVGFPWFIDQRTPYVYTHIWAIPF